jgi:hypothetical protein
MPHCSEIHFDTRNADNPLVCAVRPHTRLRQVNKIEILHYAFYGVDDSVTTGVPNDPAVELQLSSTDGFNFRTMRVAGDAVNPRYLRGLIVPIGTAPFCSVVPTNSSSLVWRPVEPTDIDELKLEVRALPGSVGINPAFTRVVLHLRLHHSHIGEGMK